MITVWPSRSSAKRAIKKALAGNETERSKCSLPRNQWPSRRRKNYYALRNVHAQRSRLAAAFVPETCPSWKRCKNDRTTLASDMLTRRTYERHDTKPAEDVDSAYSTCGRDTPAGWIEGAPGYSTAWRKRLGQRRRRRRAAPTAKRKRALRTGGVAILGAVSAWRAACAQHRASPATKYVIQKKWDM